MKRRTLLKCLALLGILAAGTRSTAQVKSVYIKNLTPCTVFVTLHMSAASSTPTCAPGFTTTTIALPSMAAGTYDLTNIPGLPPGYVGYIRGGSLLDGGPWCMPAAYMVGESACISASIIPPIAIRKADNLCTPCSTAKGQWVTTIVNEEAHFLIM